MTRAPGINTYTEAASTLADIVAAPRPWDSLAAPSNDDLIGAGLSFWPMGAAFGSPDGQAVSLDSVLARLTRAMLSPFETLYQRGFQLAMEGSVFGASALLEAWEVEYGLPDSCVSGATTITERLRALEAKVGSVAVITPEDFIRVAASYGFEIAIEEPAIFQCGFSECGGQHEIGNPREEVYWIVFVANLAIDYFRAGESECGFDLLFSIGDAERLLCILRKIAPGWTIPVLSIDALRPPFPPPDGAEWLYFEDAYPRRYISVDGDFIYSPTS